MLIEINALTLDGADGPRLIANWTWAPRAARRGRGARAGGGLVRGADGAGAARRSSRAPADGRRAICRWSSCPRARSSGWRRRYPEIEDILPLSPLQEGLLFHALYDAQGPDVYTVQLELELEGLLDAAVLEAAAAGRGGAACEPAGRLLA